MQTKEHSKRKKKGISNINQNGIHQRESNAWPFCFCFHITENKNPLPSSSRLLACLTASHPISFFYQIDPPSSQSIIR